MKNFEFTIRTLTEGFEVLIAIPKGQLQDLTEGRIFLNPHVDLSPISGTYYALPICETFRQRTLAIARNVNQLSSVGEGNKKVGFFMGDENSDLFERSSFEDMKALLTRRYGSLSMFSGSQSALKRFCDFLSSIDHSKDLQTTIKDLDDPSLAVYGKMQFRSLLTACLTQGYITSEQLKSLLAGEDSSGPMFISASELESCMGMMPDAWRPFMARMLLYFVTVSEKEKLKDKNVCPKYALALTGMEN